MTFDFFSVVSRNVPPEAPWAAVALLCAQYVTGEVVASGRCAYANGIKNQQLTQLAAEKEHAICAHAFLKTCVSRFFQDQVPEAETLKACCKVLSQVGGALVLKEEKRQRRFASAELTFRASMLEVGEAFLSETPYHFPGTQALADERASKTKGAASAKRAASTQSQVKGAASASDHCSPAAGERCAATGVTDVERQFDAAGELMETPEWQASRVGITQGTRVMASKGSLFFSSTTVHVGDVQ